MTTQTPLLTPESVGKYYRTRNGGKTKIVDYYPKEKYCYKDEYNQTFLESGKIFDAPSPHLFDIVAEWDDEPKLVPLPEEMPTDWHNLFADLIHNRMSPSAFYKKISETYGTPASKPELPSVEELAKELIQVTSTTTSKTIAKYIIDNYSLHPREWWMKLKKGDRFIFNEKVLTFERLKHYLFTEDTPPYNFNVQDCSPYTEPTPSEKFIASLTDEQKELLKSIDDKLKMLNKL